MLLEADGDGSLDRIPDSVQALIAARIDLLPLDHKRLLQQAAVVGRVFWRGALERLASDDDLESHLNGLLDRELIALEERSTIPGDRAYQFKHVLIRDVAYSAMTKAERAENHRLFADWIGERDELVEIRAHHLDRAAALVAELDGSVPEPLAHDAAAVIQDAGERTLRRESFESARRLFRRAFELEPTLDRRYLAAHAARSLGEVGAVAGEMERVRDEAREAGDRVLEGRALVALAEVAMARDGDPAAAARLCAARTRGASRTTRSTRERTRCAGSQPPRGGPATSTAPRTTRARRSRSPSTPSGATSGCAG